MRDTVMMHSYMQIISFCLSLLLALSLSLSLSHGIGSRQQQRQHLQQQWQQQWQQQQWQQQQQQWQQQPQHWHFAGIWLLQAFGFCRLTNSYPYPNGIFLIQETAERKAVPKKDEALLEHAQLRAPPELHLCPLPNGAEETPSRLGPERRALLGARDA